MITFEFATIDYNPYYSGFIVWLYSASYHAGDLLGKSGLERMKHTYLVQNVFAPIVWNSVNDATQWCTKNGYTVCNTKTVYQVTNGILHIPTRVS